MPSATCSALIRHSRAKAWLRTMAKSGQNIKKRAARTGQPNQIRPGKSNSETVEHEGIGVYSNARPLSKE